MKYGIAKNISINSADCIFNCGNLHPFSFSTILKLKDKVESVQLEDLICQGHVDLEAKIFILKFLDDLGWERFPCFLRAEISCRLFNARSVYPDKEVKSILGEILDRKLTEAEKEGIFIGSE